MKIAVQIKGRHYQAIVYPKYIFISEIGIKIFQNNITRLKKRVKYYVIYLQNLPYDITQIKIEKDKKILYWYDPNYNSRKIVSSILGIIHFAFFSLIFGLSKFYWIILSSLCSIVVFYLFFKFSKKNDNNLFYILGIGILLFFNAILIFYHYIYYYYFLIYCCFIFLLSIFLYVDKNQYYKKYYIAFILIFTIISYYSVLFTGISIFRDVKKFYSFVSIINQPWVAQQSSMSSVSDFFDIQDDKIQIKELSYIKRYFYNYKTIISSLPMYKGFQILSDYHKINGYIFILPENVNSFFTEFLDKLGKYSRVPPNQLILIPPEKINNYISYLGYKVSYKKNNSLQKYYYFAVPFLINNKEYFILFCFESLDSHDIQYYKDFFVQKVLLKN